MDNLVRQDRWDYRSLGTTLTSVYVATGRFAAYVVFRVPSLHAAAGTLLVTEAGGTISDVDGQPWSLDSDTLIAAADQQLHVALLEIAEATRPGD
jgi:myo-inositol-1(or 4)-monophosphatase